LIEGFIDELLERLSQTTAFVREKFRHSWNLDLSAI
jgi:hypothetical protein